MGLLVMLDSHTDLLEPYSIQKDFNSFTAFVKSPGNYIFFPILYKNLKKYLKVSFPYHTIMG